MFNIIDLALKIPNFLSYEECDNLIGEFEERKIEADFEKSLNYNTNEFRQSTFSVVPLRPNTNSFNFIRQKTKEAINLYIEYLDKPKLFFTHLLKEHLRFSHNYRIMKYPTGAEIHPHSDHQAGTYGSISFNLNDDYEGGEFRFFNGKHTVKLNKGDALIFPADFFWVHEVTKVTSGNRYSINSFLCDAPREIADTSLRIHHLLSEDYIKNVPPEFLLGPYN
jgi:hypothetical protein